MSIIDNTYWNEFYAKLGGTVPEVPSQFAVFIANELEPGSHVVDLGCGTGRDSLFFAKQGHMVTGIDASRSAVEHCQRRAAECELSNARFICSDVSEKALPNFVESSGRPVVAYARFFIHAIDEASEQDLIQMVSQLPGCVKFVAEFRTVRDAQQVKVTAAHYRRFVNPLDFIHRAGAYGFLPEYFIEGYGMAKYKQDDAYVARVVLIKGE